MLYNYQKLNGRIAEIVGTKSDFADRMGMNRATLTQKLLNRSSFSQDEIDKACKVLMIPPEEIPIYFFTQDVGESQYSSQSL